MSLHCEIHIYIYAQLGFKSVKKWKCSLVWKGDRSRKGNLLFFFKRQAARNRSRLALSAACNSTKSCWAGGVETGWRCLSDAVQQPFKWRGRKEDGAPFEPFQKKYCCVLINKYEKKLKNLLKMHFWPTSCPWSLSHKWKITKYRKNIQQ